MYVLTRTINEYNQEGDYLETVFETAPKLSELASYFYSKSIDECSDDEIMFLTHIKRGGGRIKTENEWYYLIELKNGEKYKNNDYD